MHGEHTEKNNQCLSATNLTSSCQLLHGLPLVLGYFLKKTDLILNVVLVP